MSFRGPDTRRSFCFSVYKILAGAGFRVFWDDDCLPIGKPMEGQLIRALRASKVAIPVISPHYAESEWCLRELTEMLSFRKQQKQRVFPVFYQVDPDEIWGSHGCFEGALRELEGLFPAEDVNLWRDSLKTLAAIKGLNPETAEGYEAGMAKMLPEKVQCDHRRRWAEELPEKLKSGYLRFFGKKRPRLDVFLAFQGADVRRHLASHLQIGLEAAGLKVFRSDDLSLIGSDLHSNFHDAIHESRVFVSILSENFASSSWCLEELAWMVELMETKGRPLLPLFHKVKAAQVRSISHPFEEAMLQHKIQQDESTFERWGKALRVVGTLKGWDSEYEALGNEGKLLKVVVKEVLKQLRMVG